jgi:hypothetical protein
VRMGWLVMFKKIAITLSAAALVMLAIALAPDVPTALATARPTVPVEAGKSSSQPLAERSCAAFETWFLDPTCNKAHAKKVARTKHHLARR